MWVEIHIVSLLHYLKVGKVSWLGIRRLDKRVTRVSSKQEVCFVSCEPLGTDPSQLTLPDLFDNSLYLTAMKDPPSMSRLLAVGACYLDTILTFVILPHPPHNADRPPTASSIIPWKTPNFAHLASSGAAAATVPTRSRCCSNCSTWTITNQYP